MRLTRLARAAALGAVACLAVTACGLSEEGTTVDVQAGSVDPNALKGAEFAVGSKDFDEQLLLGQLTILMLEAAGAETTDETNIQGSTQTRQALINGQIDVYWDYTGTGWINYLGHTKPIPDPEKQYQAVAKEDLKENGLVWYPEAPFNNTYAMATTDEFAKQNNLETLSDMAEFIEANPDQGTICAESEFIGRPDGLPGMLRTYGMDVPEDNILKFGTGVIYTELDKGTCNFGEVFTTDGRIAALGLHALEDDKGFFPLYNGSLIVRQDTDKQYPEIWQVMQPLSKKLTTDVMTELNRQVSSQGLPEEDVARQYLEEEGFLAPSG